MNFSDLSDNDEDVDVYVSPRRFVGRTPGAKAFKKRVFEDNEQVQKSIDNEYAANNPELDLAEVRYEYEFGGEKAPEQEKETLDAVRTSNIVSRIVWILNCIVGILSIVTFGLSIWICVNHRNGGVRAYLIIRGLLLRSPVAIGISLLICSVLTCFISLVWGVGRVAASIAEGLHFTERRRIIIMYQMFSSFALIYFTIILLTAINPLQKLNDTRISSTIWEDMSIAAPGDICSFELRKKCTGFEGGCRSLSARFNPSCPGRLCSETCGSQERISISAKEVCRKCRRHGFDLSYWSRCGRKERSRLTSNSCRFQLWREVRKFYIIVVVTCSIGIVSTMLMSLSGIAGPLLSVRS